MDRRYKTWSYSFASPKHAWPGQAEYPRRDSAAMVAIRIKNKWHRPDPARSTPKSPVEHAGALAFISWRLALETAKKLHKDGFAYDSDRMRVAVITEFLAFCVHLCDRLASARLQIAERGELVRALGLRLADHMQENLSEIAGPGNYLDPFVSLLNERLDDYAELSFEHGEPGYDLLRYFGRCVLDVMGETQTNRWVIDQITEIEAPELADKIRASFENLFS